MPMSSQPNGIGEDPLFEALVLSSVLQSSFLYRRPDLPPRMMGSIIPLIIITAPVIIGIERGSLVTGSGDGVPMAGRGSGCWDIGNIDSDLFRGIPWNGASGSWMDRPSGGGNVRGKS